MHDATYAVGRPQQIALETLSEAPVISREAMWFWTAFGHLGGDRNSGMGLAPIPFTAMRAYADEYRLRGHEREAFFEIIRTVDSEYIAMTEAKRKAAEPKS